MSASHKPKANTSDTKLDSVAALRARSSSTIASNLDAPELYFNRELSLLEFQRRVLEEAEDATNPLLERIKFLSILSSNLDEFFMVRVAGLMKQIARGSQEPSNDGRSPSLQLQLIREKVRKLSQDAHHLFKQELLPALARESISIVDYASLSEPERHSLSSYFLKNVFPVLTPLAVDPGRPFPLISNRSLNLAVVVADEKGAEHFARIKVPDTLVQLVPVPDEADARVPVPEDRPAQSFVWLEQLLAENIQSLFSGLRVIAVYAFRVTRDAEIAIQELESDDLLETIEEAMRLRKFSLPVRLQVDARMPEDIQQILTANLEIDSQDVYRIDGSLALSRLMELLALDRPDLKDKPFAPRLPSNFPPDGDGDFFAAIRRDDLLLHHPFDSFLPVVEFIVRAARDPDVLAIKWTLYRVGRNSPIVAALLEAIENGKQVAVLVELKARFDEESNIGWARTLEDAGVHVVYGMVGYKVHSKIGLVIRREGESIRRYVHLGTGNYNPATARLYTDFGYFTCNEAIAEDATYFFNALTGYSNNHRPQKLLVAPINLRERLEALIQREISHQEQGHDGHLIFKMNALEDPQMIKLLYRASQAGVKIDLLVRGVCCLRPGIAGTSDHIQVRSIVGRFLEHSRVFYFKNGGDEEVYLGSADLMRRNLSHRYEIVFPVENSSLIRSVKDTLFVYLSDNVKARRLEQDGRYIRCTKREAECAVDSQAWLLTHQDPTCFFASESG